MYRFMISYGTRSGRASEPINFNVTMPARERRSAAFWREFRFSGLRVSVTKISLMFVTRNPGASTEST